MARASTTHRASLLLVLACAARAGAAGIMDALDIKAVCEVPTDGPRKIYLDMGGQACSRAIQYHEFLPGQTPWHIHEYCACN